MEPKGIVLVILLYLCAITTYLAIDKPNKTELITIYTPENIYYLEGTTVSDENGLLKEGVTFNSRNHAINFLEELTVDDAQEALGIMEAIRLMDSLETSGLLNSMEIK